MANPTFFSIARRPKWIGGLFFSLAVAFVFALLGQWQLDRTFTVIEPADVKEQVEVLNQVASPGEPITAQAANVLVSANIFLDQSNVFIVSNRLQQSAEEVVEGYWVIANSGALLEDNDTTGSLTVALGYADTLEQAETARTEIKDAMFAQAFLESTGRYLQTEGPVAIADPEKPYVLGSLSLAQLVNLYEGAPVQSFAGFLAIDANPGFGLDRISLPPQEVGTQVNWLTLFYAVEWVLFGIFAVFLWWRLVEDQRLREQQAS
jgi:cytochrome oxidase assembly protein ShyY1